MNITAESANKLKTLCRLGAWPALKDLCAHLDCLEKILLEQRKQAATVRNDNMKPIDDRYVCARCYKEWVHGSPTKVCPDCKRLEAQRK
jgi:hypothetical protein